MTEVLTVEGAPHTFSSVMSLAFLIQQDVKVVDEFRQHDGMVTVMVK